MKNNNKGFSLIELSIVLIIIGLLVAGITGGASLIKSAELRAIMTEARQYKMAVNAYYTSEDSLPGDDDNNTRGSDANQLGDEDGRIELYSNATDKSVEGVEAFNDMADEDVGVLDFAQVTISANTGTVSPAIALSIMATSKSKSTGWVIDYFGNNDNLETVPLIGGAVQDVNANLLIATGEVAASDTANTNIEPAAMMTGLEAVSIDRKVDDGTLTSGGVYGLDTYTATGTVNGTSCVAADTADECAIAFKVGL